MDDGAARAALRALALDVRSRPLPERATGRASEAATLGARLLELKRSDAFRKGATMAALGLTLVGCARPSVSRTVLMQAGETHTDAHSTNGATRAALERPASSWLGGQASGADDAAPRRSPQAALIEARIEANQALAQGTPADAGAPPGVGSVVVDPGVPVDDTRVEVRLEAGVGVGQPNLESDVRALQQRLVDLGFRLDVDGAMGPSSVRALRTFTALVEGKDKAHTATSHIEPGSRLHRVLERTDLPRWMEMPEAGVGFRNIDDDHHDYGWSLVADVVHSVGQRYHDDYLSLEPNASPILTNDVSLHLGGDTPDHASHETGLDLDLRLPNRHAPGQPTRVDYASYDRDAARAQVKAFIAEPSVERVLIGDATLLQEMRGSDDVNAHKVQDGGRGHRDHIHVDISFPDLDGPEVVS